MSKLIDEATGANGRRAAWTAPVIRSVIPLSHTRGGGGDIQDQDDAFYDLS